MIVHIKNKLKKLSEKADKETKELYEELIFLLSELQVFRSESCEHIEYNDKKKICKNCEFASHTACFCCKDEMSLVFVETMKKLPEDCPFILEHMMLKEKNAE